MSHSSAIAYQAVPSGASTDEENEDQKTIPTLGRGPFSAACAVLVFFVIGAALVLVGLAKHGFFNNIMQNSRDLSDPSQLRINDDFSGVEVALYSHQQPLEHNVDSAWKSFLERTEMATELAEFELDAFKARFMTELRSKCKPLEQHEVEGQWQSIVGETLENEKPIATMQLEKAFNNQNHSYTIRVQPWMLHLSRKDLQARQGRALPTDPDEVPVYTGDGVGRRMSELPPSFDSAEHWPECAAVINRVHNQGTCASCWAFSTALSLDSRICVATGGAFQAQLSRGQITSCAISRNGCRGGREHMALRFAAQAGVSTGGLQGCIPYFGTGDGTQHFLAESMAPECPDQCWNREYHRPMHEDVFKVPDVAHSPMLPLSDKTLKWKRLKARHPDWKEVIMRAVMEQGPIPVAVFVESTFFAYASGVYNRPCVEFANHAVAMTGWGDTPSEHFVLLNSWGEDWGLSDTGKMMADPAVLCDATLVKRIVDLDGLSTEGLASPAPTAAPTTKPTPAPTPIPTPDPTILGVSPSPELTALGASIGTASLRTPAPLAPPTSPATPPARPLSKPACQDDPTYWNWRGVGCEDWAQRGWCRPWATAADFRDRIGRHALQACCLCGGGTAERPSGGVPALSPGAWGTTVEGKQCVFPFFWAGFEFTACTNFQTDFAEQGPALVLWCAIEVDSQGHMAWDQWGECSAASSKNDLFNVLEGPCTLDADGCVTREFYGNDEKCTISLSWEATLRSKYLQTEAWFDVLYVAGTGYSGSGASFLNGITTDQDILWSSDNSTSRLPGWAICNEASL